MVLTLIFLRFGKILVFRFVMMKLKTIIVEDEPLQLFGSAF